MVAWDTAWQVYKKARTCSAYLECDKKCECEKAEHVPHGSNGNLGEEESKPRNLEFNLDYIREYLLGQFSK